MDVFTSDFWHEYDVYVCSPCPIIDVFRHCVQASLAPVLTKLGTWTSYNMFMLGLGPIAVALDRTVKSLQQKKYLFMSINCLLQHLLSKFKYF